MILPVFRASKYPLRYRAPGSNLRIEDDFNEGTSAVRSMLFTRRKRHGAARRRHGRRWFPRRRWRLWRRELRKRRRFSGWIRRVQSRIQQRRIRLPRKLYRFSQQLLRWWFLLTLLLWRPGIRLRIWAELLRL